MDFTFLLLLNPAHVVPLACKCKWKMLTVLQVTTYLTA